MKSSKLQTKLLPRVFVCGLFVPLLFNLVINYQIRMLDNLWYVGSLLITGVCVTLFAFRIRLGWLSNLFMISLTVVFFHLSFLPIILFTGTEVLSATPLNIYEELLIYAFATLTGILVGIILSLLFWQLQKFLS